MKIFVTIIVNAIALWVATLLFSGLSVGDPTSSTTMRVATFAVVACIFGLVNSVVRPIVKLVTLPLYLLTLGLFSFVVNALMIKFTAWLSQFTPFHLRVDRFFWTAVGAGLVIALVSWALNLVFGQVDKD